MTNFQFLVKESNKSLTEISHETGISYSTLGNYNQGTRTPKKENAKILADYFGVSIPYLLGLDDNPNLVDPGAPKEVLKGFAKILQGKSSIENKINKWTPFGDELAIILAEINQSEALADYIDFLASKKDFNPILVKAIKEFIADKNGKLKKVKLVKLEPKKDPKTGRMNMTEIAGSEFEIPADFVLIAAGFLGTQDYIAKAFGVKLNARTNVETEPGSYKTNVDKVYTAGDMHRGQSLVVWGINEGRHVAKEVDKALMGYTNLE